jgi:hypothetical protein
MGYIFIPNATDDRRFARKILAESEIRTVFFQELEGRSIRGELMRPHTAYIKTRENADGRKINNICFAPQTSREEC